jgi:hypothetical protein
MIVALTALLDIPWFFTGRMVGVDREVVGCVTGAWSIGWPACGVLRRVGTSSWAGIGKRKARRFGGGGRRETVGTAWCRQRPRVSYC